MKRVIVSFSFLQIEESGKLISKPFVISNIKFANPLYAFGKVANFDLGNFATLPNAKMALANFNLLNLLNLNPSSPFCHQRGRGREPVPYISQHISQPPLYELSAISGMSQPLCTRAFPKKRMLPSRGYRDYHLCISPSKRQPHQQRQLLPKLRAIGNRH